MAGPKFPLLCLCDEIIVLIASYLDFKDRKNFRLVCRKLKSISDSSSLWKRTVYINTKVRRDCKQLARLLLGRNVQRLGFHRSVNHGVTFLRELSKPLSSTLKGLDICLRYNGCAEDFEAFSECRNLDTLDIDAGGFYEEKQINQMNCVLKKFDRLQDITISNICACSKSSGNIIRVLCQLPHLLHISLENWNVSILDLHTLLHTHTDLLTLRLSNVEMVHISQGSEVPMDKIPHLRELRELHIHRDVIHMKKYMFLLGLGHRILPSLRILSLAGSIDKLPLIFWSTLPNLQDLRLRHNCLHDEDLNSIDTFACLHSLTLRNSIGLSERALQGIAVASGSTLYTLVLHNCSKVRFEKVKFWRHLTVLRCLILTGCIQLSEHGLQQIVTSVPSLKTIDITGCGQISQRCISFLKQKSPYLKWIV